MPRRLAERSRAIRRIVGASAVAVAALAMWASPAAAVEPTVTRNCDGSVSVTLTAVPTNLTATVHNVRIVGDQVLFELHYDWQDDPAPEQIEQRALPLPPIPPDCTPQTVPPTTPPPTTTPPTPGFAFSIRSECRNDTPVVVYEASISGFAAGTPMVLHWVANGVERFTQTVALGSGEVLWPGAEVDAAGQPTDWPGWVQQSNGEWIEAPDGFEWARPEVQVFATVNPTSEAIGLTYPPATPRCQARPDDPGGSTLPDTGANSQAPLVAGGTLLVALGTGLVIATRQRMRTGRSAS
jgi:LPXTG-motif cell wall-anchored protein